MADKNNEKKPGVYLDKEGSLTQNVYLKRSEVESDAFLRKKGALVITEFGEELTVPRWSIELTDKLGRAISHIIGKIYPNQTLFIQQLDTMSDVEGAEFTYQVLFIQCIAELKQIVFITLHLDDDAEACSKFVKSHTIMDFINIVNAIVQQEIQNPMLVALVKKTVSEIMTKLQSVNLSTPSVESMDGQ